MYRPYNKYGQRAQSIMEYVSLITILAIVLITMSTYVRRGVQGFIKITADQLGNQLNSEQAFDDKGYLMNAITLSRSVFDKRRDEQLGVFNYVYGDSARSRTFTALNAGFTFRPNN